MKPLVPRNIASCPLRPALGPGELSAVYLPSLQHTGKPTPACGLQSDPRGTRVGSGAHSGCQPTKDGLQQHLCVLCSLAVLRVFPPLVWQGGRPWLQGGPELGQNCPEE